MRILPTLWSIFAAASLMAAAHADTVLVHAAAYPEGPLWRDGALLYVEYAGSGIKRWDGTRAIAFWSGEHCGASGLIDYRNDHILVACYDANSIVELDRTGKQIRVIDRDSAGKPFIGPNDFAADRRGGIYVSASGVYDLKAPITGTILHMAADGVPVEVANLIHYSNGLTLSKDGKSLLVSEMLAGRILSFPIQGRRPPGTPLGLGAPAGSRAAHRPRGRLQRARRPQTGTRRQLLHRAKRLGPGAGGERGPKIGTPHHRPHALCDQHELRRGRGRHAVHHRRFRPMEGAVPWRRLSMEEMISPTQEPSPAQNLYPNCRPRTRGRRGVCATMN